MPERRGARPGAVRGDPLGRTAALGTVVHMPDQLPAQRDTQQHLGVSGELGDVPAAAELDDGERGAGALDLAGGGRQEGAGGDQVASEDGGHLLGGQAVAHGQLQRLALLGGRAGGLRPGQGGQFAAAARRFGGVAGTGRGAELGGRARTEGGDALVRGGVRTGPGVRGRWFRGNPGTVVRSAVRGPVREPPQAGPPGQRVQPGAVEGGVGGPSAVVPVGDGEHLAEDGGGRVVLAQDGQTVGEQAVQVGFVPLGEARQGAAAVAVRLMCAGGVRGVIGPAAHHPATVGG
ncbi:hypothetical protein SRIMM317S_01090 [Streptomyces rimosus subsp. rimosus]